jgi:hypothetical protein
MACGNNEVSRSGLHSEPTPLAGPSDPAASRTTSNPQQVAAMHQQARNTMEQAERKASTATNPSAARDAVKDAQRALDTARRMHGQAKERASLIRELESKLEDIRRAAANATDLHDQAVRTTEQVRRDQEPTSRIQSGDRLSRSLLGVPPHVSTQSGNNVGQRQGQSAWEPRGSQAPDVGVIAATGQVVSFKTGGPTGDQTLIADGDYSDDKEGFDQNHNHYGSAREGGWIDQDRGHYTGPDH